MNAGVLPGTRLDVFYCFTGAQTTFINKEAL